MTFKIYVPFASDAEIYLPECIPFLYPFYNNSKSANEKISFYGNWFLNVQITSTPQQCHAIVLPYNVGYYYIKKQQAFLKMVNNLSVTHGVPIICATKGDMEVTPRFANYQLYRMGGYASKNPGNHFAYPVFMPDPLPLHYNGQLTWHTTKTPKPIVGFCGQAKGGFKKWAIDIARGLYRRVLKIAGKWPYDNERLESTTCKRSKILDLLEASPLVQTNFIRHTQYRGGFKTPQQKEEQTKMFFNNMQQSQYIVCYRGAGNYSVRLYETLAAGRIPVIVKSDSNMPFEGEINWAMFPVIEEKDIPHIARLVANFHAQLTDVAFIQLQKEARTIWEGYLSYKGFMAHWFAKYARE